MSSSRAYDEVIDFIAAGSSPGEVIAFRPSPAAKARVADLVTREKAGSLTSEETLELDYYLQLEHIMRLAKARATKYLPSQ